MQTCNNGIECPLAIESNHRIANHMALLASYVALRRREYSKMPDTNVDTIVLRLLDGIGAQVAAVSELHRMLTTCDSLSSGDIGAHLGRICEAFRKGPALGMALEYSGGAGCNLPVNHILPVSQIISEVVTNALKYGHKAGCAGSIRVGCLRGSDDRITISVDDDGDGIGAGKTLATKSTGIGSAIVAALVRQVGGTIEYRFSDSGLSFGLSLPSAVHAEAMTQQSLGQHDCENA